MKIRTKNYLFDKIDADRVWRIREIGTLRAFCTRSSMQQYERIALKRAFVPIAYAHWEGFVKNAAQYYLEFVVMQNLEIGQLSFPFMSLYLCSRFSRDLDTQENERLAELCKLILDNPEERINITYKNVISTRSNLDSKVLKSICRTLGISFSLFETKSKFIDSKLVGRRNHIAHGEHQEIDDEELDQIKDEVVYLIDTFRSEVQNAAELESFKRTSVGR